MLVHYVDPATLGFAQAEARAGQVLNEEELARYRGFVCTRSAREFLTGRLLLRTLLSHYLPGTAPRDWKLIENAYGRPELEAGVARGLRFNLSHSAGWVVCAVTRDREIGVDVEDTTRCGGLEEVAESAFSDEERANLARLPDPGLRTRRFFEFWTLKEAYIKARGMGLALPLDQVSFAGERATFGPGVVDEPERWQFTLRRVTEGLQAALAVTRTPGEEVGVLEFRCELPTDSR